MAFTPPDDVVFPPLTGTPEIDIQDTPPTDVAAPPSRMRLAGPVPALQIPDDIVWPDARPRAPAQAGASSIPEDVQWPESVSPPLTDYPIEFGKSAVEGAKNTVASALKGAGALASTSIERPTERRLRAQTPEELERAIALEQSQQRPQATSIEQITSHPLYQAGEAIESFGKDTLGPRPGFEGRTWTRDIGGGFGSVGAGIGVALLNPAAAG
jgi:hypothetical protein